jgi:hypothetical protein
LAGEVRYVYTAWREDERERIEKRCCEADGKGALGRREGQRRRGRTRQ